MYYLLDPIDQSFGVKSKEKRARWAGVDESIDAKMCYNLVDDESGKIICPSVIRSATEPGTANLRIDSIEPLPSDTDAILDEMMSTADFETPLSTGDPVDSIPASTKFKTWQKMEQDNQLEHQEDVQQRYFHSSQPKSTVNKQHRYPTRSKTSANKVKTALEGK